MDYKINGGLPVKVMAILPNGDIMRFDSKQEAARNFGFSLQYVHKSCKKDVLRPFQSNDKNKRPVRFCLADNKDGIVLSELNKNTW